MDDWGAVQAACTNASGDDVPHGEDSSRVHIRDKVLNDELAVAADIASHPLESGDEFDCNLVQPRIGLRRAESPSITSESKATMPSP